MKAGCHVSISGGIDRAVDNASERKCTAFQVFTRNPRGWHAKEITDAEAGLFRSKLKESGIDPQATCAHMPYLPNLASPKADLHAKSVASLKAEAERCSRLGIPYLVTHLGSHLGTGDESGISQLTRAYEEAASAKSGVTILLENTAGQKNSVGSDFAQLGKILKKLRPARSFGVCIDTCHAFAYGYDLSTKKGVRDAFSVLDEEVGLNRLKILHLNDAKAECGSRLDRHYHLGLGQIGMEGIRASAQAAAKNGTPVILETPIDDVRDDFENVRIAQGLA